MIRRIIILGSANMDLVFALDQLPKEGETRTGGDVALFPGGKGANQAVAAARNLQGRVPRDLALIASARAALEQPRPAPGR